MERRLNMNDANAVVIWTARDVADFLKMSERWVRQSSSIPDTEPGSIPHFRIGRRARFIADDVRDWVLQACPTASEFARRMKIKASKNERMTA